MSKGYQPVLRLDDLEREPFSRGTSYECLDALISKPLGLTQIGAILSEVPPGKSGCPYHVHRVEDEMFVILKGRGEYRFGGKTYEVKAGDVLGAPRGGPEFAHKLVNTGAEVLQYLCISSKADTEVCEYPDSGKFLVRTHENKDRPEFRFIGRLADDRDYWEGEEGS